MATRLDVDPSRPFQREGSLLAIWLPRGRGRDDRAAGLLCTLRLCTKPECVCTEAQLNAIPVDDRLRWAKLNEGRLTMKWWDEHEASPMHPLTLDLLTGSVTDARGGELAHEVRPFFREPIAAWLLDDIYAEWAETRPHPRRIDDPLARWEPGDLVSVFDAYPSWRPDTYLRDGRKFVVDLSFCVAPDCPCTLSRFLVLAVEETPTATRWVEIGSVELDGKMPPRRFVGEAEHQQTVIALYLDWRARSGNADERFAELRRVVRAHGATLHERARDTERTRPSTSPFTALGAPPPLPSAPTPGRNEPCPCGSGKKYKRCCASRAPSVS